MGINAQGIYEWDGTETFPEWRDDLTASITATVADINSDIAGIAVPADSGWVTISTLATGWTATAGYTPRVRKVGDFCTIEGALTRTTTTGLVTNLLTLPVGYRPAKATTTGATVTSGGQVLMQNILSSGVLTLPTGYVSAAIGSGVTLFLTGSWYVN